MKILHKLVLTTCGLFLIAFSMFLATYFVTKLQKDDGLVVNLAGRQRMLTQKMTKEILYYRLLMESPNANPLPVEKNIRNTMKIFDTTLYALKDSGNAPLSLNLKETKYRKCPKAEEPAFSQLEKVAELWKIFSSRIYKILEKGVDSQEDLDWIMKNNLVLLKEMNSAVVMLQQQSEKRVHQLLLIQITGILLFIFISIFSLWVSYGISKSIKSFGFMLKDIAQGEGNLTKRLRVSGKDEIHETAKWFNLFIEKIQKIILDISRNTDTLNTFTGNLLDLSERVANSAGETLKKSQMVVHASDEVNANISNITSVMDAASQTTHVLGETSQAISTGIADIAEYTSNTKEMTENTVTHIQQATSKMEELTLAAGDIGNITGTITDISEQTNLLALNATIEAARAGNAGKGFAIVAGEIKELSSQTASATKLINDSIHKVSSCTDAANQEMTNVSRIVYDVNSFVATLSDEMDTHVNTSNVFINELRQTSGRISLVNENITKASASTTKIATEMTEMNQLSDEINGSTEKMNEDIRSLNALSENLKAMVDQFIIK